MLGRVIGAKQVKGKGGFFFFFESVGDMKAFQKYLELF